MMYAKIFTKELRFDTRLVVTSIADMTLALERQKTLPKEALISLSQIPNEALFNALEEWQWRKGVSERMRLNTIKDVQPEFFFALPIGTEIFDGEMAYLLYASGQAGRFIWRDYEKK